MLGDRAAPHTGILRADHHVRQGARRGVSKAECAGVAETSPQTEAGWRHAKLRYPVGAVVSARVASVFPSNREYWIIFTGDDSPQWSGALLQWTGEQPAVAVQRAFVPPRRRRSASAG